MVPAFCELSTLAGEEAVAAEQLAPLVSVQSNAELSELLPDGLHQQTASLVEQLRAVPVQFHIILAPVEESSDDVE